MPDPLTDGNIKNGAAEKPLGESLENPLWTVKDVARYLRLEPETVRAMARREELPGFKVGRMWRFKPLDVKRNLQDN